jgi:hypothetical protein
MPIERQRNSRRSKVANFPDRRTAPRAAQTFAPFEEIAPVAWLFGKNLPAGSMALLSRQQATEHRSP